MSKNLIKGELEVEEFEFKEELHPSTVEDTCTVFVQGGDVKIETETKGKQTQLKMEENNKIIITLI